MWASVTALSVAAAVLTVLAWSDLMTQDAVSNLSGAPAAVLYATLGALVVRRAGNVIGWLLLGEGAGLAIMSLASAYAVLGITHPGTLPAPELVGLLAEWSFIPVLTGIGFMLLLFPSGSLPSPRWRPFAGLGLLATALTMIGFVVRPRLVALPAPGDKSLMFENPLGIRSLGPVLSTVLIGTVNGLAVLGTVHPGGGLRLPGGPLPVGRARRAAADQMDRAGGSRVDRQPARGAAGCRGHWGRV